MEQLLLHPKVVHLPIALAVLMPLLTSGLALAWWRGWLQRRAWIIAVALQALLVASGVVALKTGEVDEEHVERVVAERFIEAHEEAAEVFVWSAVGVFILVLGAGLIPRDRFALAAATVATVGTVAVLGLGYRVGEAGGALVYEHGAASAYTAGTTGNLPPPRASDDDEDDDDD